MVKFDQREVYANHVLICRQIGRIYEPSSDIKRYLKFTETLIFLLPILNLKIHLHYVHCIN